MKTLTILLLLISAFSFSQANTCTENKQDYATLNKCLIPKKKKKKVIKKKLIKYYKFKDTISYTKPKKISYENKRENEQ